MAIDLEHFPTNETALRMMERISPIYDRSYVGKWIFEIMGMEMGEARAYFEELRQQPFPERTTWAIEYWERRYAITPKPTDDLATRRQNIIMKRGIMLPMNPARMEEIINGLTGGSSTITENVEDYTFAVDIDGVSPGVDLSRVLKEIKKRKPSHQTFMLSMSAPPVDYKLGLLATAGRISTICLPEWKMVHDFRKTMGFAGAAGRISTIRLPRWNMQHEFRRTVGFAAAAGRIGTTRLPQWHMEYDFRNGAVAFAAAAGRISITRLPEWRMPHDFHTEAKMAGGLNVISTVTLPPAE